MSIERSDARSELTSSRVSIEPLTTRWGRIVLVGLLAILPWGVLAPRPAVADDCVTTVGAGEPDVTQTPWSQLRIRPERVWPLTTGHGVTVAVIDSGIDVRRPQLAGQVIEGKDFLGSPGGPSTVDCAGQGTPVAGIIAAKPLPKLPIWGVAPGAKVLSIRQVEVDGDKTRGTLGTLTLAIREAVTRGARVINVSAGWNTDDPRMRAAVEFALARDVVVVAAAGNDDTDIRPELAAKAVYWPARYDGVVAVAASNREDKRADATHDGSYVDVAAPGADVPSTGANGPLNYTSVSGSRIAAPFVAGTAALIRSYYPNLNARQVVARLTATADIPPQGRGRGLGTGIVNPYAAVTAVIPAEGLAASARPAPVPVTVPALPAPPDHTVRNRALAASGAAVGVALLVAIAVVVFPSGRAGRWQPRRREPTAGS